VWHLRSSSILSGGPDGSRRRIPRRVARLLTVVAFTRCVPAWHGGHRLGLLRRPPTSCAHRLRKPDRTLELLALSVARWAHGRGLLTPRLRARPHGRDGSLTGRRNQRPPPRQIRRCRRRFRTTATGQTRTPSLGSTRTLRPEQAPPRSLFTRTASPHTLSSAASLGLPRQGPAGRLGLSRAGMNRLTADTLRGEKDVSHRLLQPTPVTSTPRLVRFPVAPCTASLHLAAADR